MAKGNTPRQQRQLHEQMKKDQAALTARLKKQAQRAQQQRGTRRPNQNNQSS